MESNQNNTKIKWLFFGTDEFSVKVLDTLKSRGFLPTLIVTVPDQPKGRKLVLTPPPAKLWALENHIDFLQPSSLKDPAFDLQLRTYNLQLFMVASYGKIISQAILDLPAHGTLNIHPSLLPKYRGATPLESAILSGDDKTGVSIIKLDAEMDHGPILSQTEISFEDKPFYNELRDKTAEAGANLLADILPKYLSGELIPAEQDHSLATYTKKIEKTDGLIDLTANPELNYRKIRAFTPWPGAYFFIKKDERDLRVVIKKAHLDNGELIIDSVVPEGKNEMDWASFQRGYLK
ncbi:MAG: methionyl-tRNA formyltransferase [Candidatus Vogelbacteria bacterium]|nr:methionyl-tRNA formyltransferase [Candidatus Vogelbacteria bacterium]